MWVVIAVYTNSWFNDSELSFAIGVSSSVPSGISFFSGIITPYINSKSSLAYAFGLGFIICILSLFCSFLLTIIDKKAEKNDL